MNKTGIQHPLGAGGGAILQCKSSYDPCQLWTASADGEFIFSGNNKGKKMIDTTLQITKGFAAPPPYKNSVEFQYRVDAELCRYGKCDGLSFSIDENLVLPNANTTKSLTESRQLQWATFKWDVTPGPHVLKWSYYKGYSGDQGEDFAALKHIVLKGVVETLQDASRSCASNDLGGDCSICPTGQYSDSKGSTECTKCPAGKFANKQGRASLDDCSRCSPDEFSMPGAHGCTPKPACNYDDIVTINEGISICKKSASSDNGWSTRKTASQLDVLAGNDKEKTCAEPRDSDELTKLLVPGEIPCQCDPGKQLTSSAGGTRCTLCPFGQYQNGSMARCESCPEGNVSVPGRYITDFSQHTIVSSNSCLPGTTTPAWTTGDYHLCTSVVADEESVHGWAANGNVRIVVVHERVKTSVKHACFVTCRTSQPRTHAYVCAHDPVVARRCGTNKLLLLIIPNIPTDICNIHNCAYVFQKVATPGRTLGDVETVLVWHDLDPVAGSTVLINCSINCNTTSGQAASSDACRLEIKLLNSSGIADKSMQFNCGCVRMRDIACAWCVVVRGGAW